MGQSNFSPQVNQKKDVFLVSNFFSSGVAGFTKPSFKGNLPFDSKALPSFMPRGFAFSYMDQQHTARICLINRPGAHQADGMFTRKKRLFLFVKTADCLPLLFAGPSGWIGGIHMGWKSAQKGILKNISFTLTGWKVFAGPGLRCCCYQVGREFLAYSEFSHFLREASGSLFFDPVQFAKESLISLGLKEKNFFDSNLCTFCSKQGLFSYRRDKTPHRTFSFIGRN